MIKILLVDTDQLHMKALRKRIAMHMDADVVCISTYKEILELGKHTEFTVAYVAIDICNQKQVISFDIYIIHTQNVV